MTDEIKQVTTVSQVSVSGGNSQVVSAIVAAILASYCMTQLSLHGVDFETLGVSSEIIKSTLIGFFVGFFTKLTPANLVGVLKEIIIFRKRALKELHDAAENGRE